MKDLYKRVAIVAETQFGSRAALAKVMAPRLGITPRTFEGYFSKARQNNFWPLLNDILAVCPQVRRDWLYHGEGEILVDPETEKVKAQTTLEEVRDLLKSASASRIMRVIGLANCGSKGWYVPGPLSVSISIPNTLVSEDAFAVLAVGDSMRPAGIIPGHVLICDPRAEVVPNDKVYIKLKDGTASIKVFQRKDAEWVYLQSWMDPHKITQVQKPYCEKRLLDTLEMMCPIIYTKMKD